MAEFLETNKILHKLYQVQASKAADNLTLKAIFSKKVQNSRWFNKSTTKE